MFVIQKVYILISTWLCDMAMKRAFSNVAALVQALSFASTYFDVDMPLEVVPEAQYWRTEPV